MIELKTVGAERSRSISPTEADMAKTRQQKQAEVVRLQEKIRQARAYVFADYRGLTMKQLSELRNKLSDVNGEFTITKNTLLEHALPESKFEGPTATLFAYDDEISPIKILVKTLKDAALGKIKSGFLGTDVLDEAKIIQLSTLPTKDELRGKTVGVLVAPLQGMVGVLQANLSNLVYALSEIQKVKGGV